MMQLEAMKQILVITINIFNSMREFGVRKSFVKEVK